VLPIYGWTKPRRVLDPGETVGVGEGLKVFVQA
jgi:hypothetical protein